MTGGASGTDEGAAVLLAGDTSTDVIEVRATTLDALLADHVGTGSRVLLKLDVESHELEVLSGAESVLRQCEVVVSEFRLFVDDPRYPTLHDLMVWLLARGFILYDVASLKPRVRDRRLMFGDVVFVRATASLASDSNWT